MTKIESTLRTVLLDAVPRLEAADLVYGHGTDTALDEAAFLLLESLGLPPDDLEPHLEKSLTAEEISRFENLIAARITTRKPAPYLVNKAYIRGLPFYVDERVIVPRSFIGEILLHEDGFTLAGDPEKITSVLDLCTGSGCLAIIAAMIFPNAHVDAIDLSVDALDVARKNIALHGFEDCITLYRGDLFAPLKNKKYDLIITNPPYVDAKAMDELPPEYEHEPAMALGSGEDGLDLVRKILAEASGHLNPCGSLLCEIGRGKPILERDYPKLPFLWIDTENSEGEVFYLKKEQLAL